MLSGTGLQHQKAYARVHTLLASRGPTPRLMKLDNAASAHLNNFLATEGVKYQLVTPHDHKVNGAEGAICTAKNHIIAGLCSVDPDFPLHLWDRLLPQAVITLICYKDHGLIRNYRPMHNCLVPLTSIVHRLGHLAPN